MQIDRHQGIAGALDFSDKLADLPGVQKELAGSHGVRPHVSGGFGERAYMGADKEYLAAAYYDVSFLDLRPAGPDGLDFPALQGETRFEALLDEVIMERLAVLYDAHWDPARASGRGL